jgi:hypothetical protein
VGTGGIERGGAGLQTMWNSYHFNTSAHPRYQVPPCRHHRRVLTQGARDIRAMRDYFELPRNIPESPTRISYISFGSTWIQNTIVRKQDALPRPRKEKRRPDYAPSQASFAGVGGVKTTFTACSMSSLAPKTTGWEGEMRIGEKDFGRILPR